VNDNFEFVKNNKIQKIFFSKYYNIDKNSYKILEKKNKNSKIIIAKNKIFFVEKYLLEEKIPFSQAKKFFKIFITYKKNFILL
jgi:hypothetical protein